MHKSALDRLEILVQCLQPCYLAAAMEGAILQAAQAHIRKNPCYPAGNGGDDQPTLMPTDFVTGVLRDHEALETLLGERWQQRFCEKTNGSNNTQQLFETSFLLRHAATWVALVWKQHQRENEFIRLDAHCGSPYSVTESNLRRQSTNFLNSSLFFESRLPQIALSARGIEWAVIPKHACSHFDPYATEPCWARPLTQGGACGSHVGHDWGQSSFQSGLRQMGAMRQSALFAFYGNIKNLSAYSEDELNKMVQSFWHRMSRFNETKTDLEQAAQAFGYRSLSDVLGTGVGELKMRFRSEARRVHPDAGGAIGEFQRVERAYRALLEAMDP